MADASTAARLGWIGAGAIGLPILTRLVRGRPRHTLAQSSPHSGEHYEAGSSAAAAWGL